jgi:CSLREA domain-containing protein
MRKLVLTALISLAALYAAAGANAAPITVNTNLDGAPANDGICTLREAIEASNTDTSSGAAAGECAAGSGTDTINFAASFDGQLADTIDLFAAGQSITQPVTVDGGDCDATAAARPCVGINGGGESAFVVRADNVTIQGFAITNAANGVEDAAVGPEGDALTVRNSWFGLNVDGTPGTANATGVFLSHDDATIGGSTPAGRNVIAKNTTGVRLVTGDGNAIEGNYFGTEADGDANAALGNALANVQIQTVSADVPLNNTIGGADAGTPTTCDGRCNLLAPTAGSLSIVLFNGLSAAGQTQIAGNFIGVSLAGGQLGTGFSEVRVGDADGVTVGGADAANRNYIGLGAVTVDSGAVNAVIRNNFLGLNPAGDSRIDAGGRIRLDAATGVLVADNRIAQSTNGSSALVLFNSPSNTVRGNIVGAGTGNEDVGGGPVAIDVFGDGSDGNTIGGAGAGDGNTVGNTSTGIQLFEGDSNTVQGNGIGTNAAGTADLGFAGVGVDIGGSPSTGNVVGGPTAAAENVISNLTNPFQTGDAIRVLGDGNDGNQILRNRGDLNAGLFADLGANLFGNGPSGPNDDIAAPVISGGATSILVSGTGAESGATVRVYRTGTAASGDPNGLIAFAGEAVADGSGNWSLACPSPECTGGLPGGGRVTANQTDVDGNSSEFSKAVSFTDLPPDTAIDSGPAEASTTGDTTPTLGFSSSEPSSTFECKVDGGVFAACTSPHTTAALGDGVHTFQVRAKDSALQVDASPATRSFTVDATAPETQIDSGPAAGSTTDDSTPTFGFSASEAGSTFECRTDGGAFAACSSAHTTAALADGQHTFEVRATDAVGNTDGSPAARTFTVDAVADPGPTDPGPTDPGPTDPGPSNPGPTDPGGAADTDPPQTTITEQPKDKLRVKKTATVTYEFVSSEPGSTFRCKVDGKAQAPCTSPLTLRGLKKGKHSLEVVAVDAAGNADPTPATDAFEVKKKRKRRR